MTSLLGIIPLAEFDATKPAAAFLAFLTAAGGLGCLVVWGLRCWMGRRSEERSGPVPLDETNTPRWLPYVIFSASCLGLSLLLRSDAERLAAGQSVLVPQGLAPFVAWFGPRALTWGPLVAWGAVTGFLVLRRLRRSAER